MLASACRVNWKNRVDSTELNSFEWVNENLYMAHKNLHTKPYVFTVPDTQYIHVGTLQTSLSGTFLQRKDVVNQRLEFDM